MSGPGVEIQGGVTATVKGGKGYDDPWIVFHGVDPDHVRSLINEARACGLVADVAALSSEFAGVELVHRADQSPPRPQAAAGGAQGRQGGGGYGGGAQAPQGAPANHGLATHCRHGEKLWVSGVSQRTQKPWGGFDCPQNYKEGECNRFAKA